jgi:hypothetical protein
MGCADMLLGGPTRLGFWRSDRRESFDVRRISVVCETLRVLPWLVKADSGERKPSYIQEALLNSLVRPQAALLSGG